MTSRVLSEHTGKVAIGCGLIGAIIYLLMINVTLAHIQTISGQIPFDMRPLGYRPADADALLDAMGTEGRTYYLSRQIPLDTLYPAILALTLISAIRWFGQGLPDQNLARCGILLSVGAAVFDYLENTGIVIMIWNWPDLSDPLLLAVSTATVVKSILTTLAVLSLLFTGGHWLRLRKSRIHT